MKEIPLTQGLAALVDDRDFDVLVAIGPWFAHKVRYTHYAVRKFTHAGVRFAVPMHAALLGARGNKRLVDHIDGNGLNNQRSNLRLATQSQNGANKRKQSNGVTSVYRGVSTHKRRPGMWRAVIQQDGKPKELGFFPTPELAARAYDRAAIDAFGEFARLNFGGV